MSSLSRHRYFTAFAKAVAFATAATTLAGCSSLLEALDSLGQASDDTAGPVQIVVEESAEIEPAPIDVQVETPSSGGAPGSSTHAGDTANLADIAAAVEAETGSSVGVAFNGQAAGSLQTDVAWSTSKVPVAIAALRENPGLSGTMWSAIAVSDNASAQALWDSLGGGEAAAAAVNQVLRDGGDHSTMANPYVLRSGFTAFGQTQWSVSDQAVFASNLPNIPGAAEVLDAMGNVAGGQRYGLGQIPGARFKGGWGPGVNGGYLVRQFGLVPGSNGDVGVAIMAFAGDYGSGQYVLNVLTERIRPLL